VGIYVPTKFGVVGGYHRMLSHKSFKTHKWLEYLIASLGTCSGQSHPIEWVSRHRQHHRHSDTPLDPHTPHEGFWWCYCLWLTGSEWSIFEYGNCPDLYSQFFYRWGEWQGWGFVLCSAAVVAH
jgi:stearoyl-CoA desaturase (delta-9 desaturase)